MTSSFQQDNTLRWPNHPSVTYMFSLIKQQLHFSMWVSHLQLNGHSDNSITPIYRLYSCSLLDTFSNGTLGTGFCEFCLRDSHPEIERERERERGGGEGDIHQLNFSHLAQPKVSCYYLPGRPIWRWEIRLLWCSYRPAPLWLQWTPSEG